MIVLKREDILAIEDIQKELVEIPEWGGSVWVYGMTAAERDHLEKGLIQTKGKDVQTNLENIRAKLAVICVRDEDGKRIFNEADIHELGRKSASALDRIFDVAQRLSGLSTRDIEELSKNSESGQSDGSISD